MKPVFGWLVRKGMIYILLCAAFAFYLLIWPSIAPQFSGTALRLDAMSMAELRGELSVEASRLNQRLAQREDAIRRSTQKALGAELARADRELAAKKARLADQGWLDGVRPSRIVLNEKLKLGIKALELEIAGMRAAVDQKDREERLRTAEWALSKYSQIPTEVAVIRSKELCLASQQKVAAFEKRYPFERGLRNAVWDERNELIEARVRICSAAESREQKRRAGLAAAKKARDARAAADKASGWMMGAVNGSQNAIGERTIGDVAVLAAKALAILIAMPFLIRLLFWFVLAPIAERRPAIRLAVPGGARGPIEHQQSSSVSIAVTLKPTEELLVRQDYLQSTPVAASKATQFFLDWRHPISSVASGMRFLTRIRGEGTTTTVSATNDPFAEVALIELPEDGSCVIHPRALAAVAQPRGRPIRITSHWRLFKLNAWLTGQLRYLVFHGPARLVLKGGRGIRVEQAQEGRIFGTGQMVGFSADLAYSVARNETFWPYFLGREPLLRDRVKSGSGVLIVEEAPLAGRHGQAMRRGLEGAVDALLKGLGI